MLLFNRVIVLAATLAAILAAFAAPSYAQLQNENLLATMPAGFKVGSQSSRNGLNMQEFIPASETVQDWTEMVTVQVFLNKGALDPIAVLRSIEQGWRNACKESKPMEIKSGVTNGYSSARMFAQCPLLSSTGKPETAIFKAIKGNDSFYMVQRAVRSLPSADKLQAMGRYLDDASVCDTRAPNHPCPDLSGQGFKRVQ